MARQHLGDPHDAVALPPQVRDQALHLGLDLRGVGRAGAQHHLHVGGQLGDRAQEQRQPLLPGDPADEDHRGPVRVDAELAHPVGVGARRPVVGVDAVVHDVDAAGVDGRVAAQHVVAHRRRHRDHRRGRFVRRPLHPGGDRVPAAELLGLPRPQRLQRVRADHVRHAVQQRGEVAGEVGVPGVGVDQVRAGAAVGDREVDAEGAQRRVGVGELGEVGVGRGQRLLTRRAERVHPGLEVGQPAQRTDQLGHVHPRAAVDLRGVLLAQDVDAHGANLLRRRSGARARSIPEPRTARGRSGPASVTA